MMISDKQEQEFKKMIQSTGYESAPDHMVRSVIEKLELEAKPAISGTQNLIPRWMWLGLGAAFCISLVYLMSDYQSIGIDLFREFSYTFSIPEIQFTGLPELEFGRFGGLALCLILPALLIQFFFIKGYYENKV